MNCLRCKYFVNKCIYEYSCSKKNILDSVYQQGREDCLNEMLKLSEEWKNNGGSFLDFQRVLRQKIEEQNNDR